MSIEPIMRDYILQEREIPDRTIIIKEGTPGILTYVVLSGRVKIKKKTPRGVLTVDTLGEGAIIGEMRLLTGDSLTATATVVADGAVKIGQLDSNRLAREFGTQSPQLQDLLRSLILNLKRATDQVSGLAGTEGQ